jgi:DNA-binding NtrC family response regulator
MMDTTAILSQLVGSGARMQAVREFLRLNAGDLTPVAIVGERGTGRRFLARLLRDLSPPPAGQGPRQIVICDAGQPSTAGWLQIALPPLRNRIEDVPALIDHFLSLSPVAAGGPPKRLAPSARQSLRDYPWPGNVHELQQLCTWLARTCACAAVRRGCLPSRFQQVQVMAMNPASPGRRGLDAQLRALEERLIGDALQEAGFNRSRAARLLEIKRSTLGDRIERLGMTQKWTEDVA